MEHTVVTLNLANYVNSISGDDPEAGLKSVLHVLESCMVSNGVIVCLQGVSHQRYGPLAAWFQQEGYTFAFSGYKADTNTGIGIAFHNILFTLEKCMSTRLADTFGAQQPTPLARSEGQSLTTRFMDWMCWNDVTKSSFDVVHETFQQEHTILAVHLSSSSSSHVVIATCQLPRQSGSVEHQQVVLNHMALALQAVREFTSIPGEIPGTMIELPYVLAGDFNVDGCPDLFAMVTKNLVPRPFGRNMAHYGQIFVKLPLLKNALKFVSNDCIFVNSSIAVKAVSEQVDSSIKWAMLNIPCLELS